MMKYDRHTGNLFDPYNLDESMDNMSDSISSGVIKTFWACIVAAIGIGIFAIKIGIKIGIFVVKIAFRVLSVLFNYLYGLYSNHIDKENMEERYKQHYQIHHDVNNSNNNYSNFMN